MILVAILYGLLFWTAYDNNLKALGITPQTDPNFSQAEYSTYKSNLRKEAALNAFLGLVTYFKIAVVMLILGGAFQLAKSLNLI